MSWTKLKPMPELFLIDPLTGELPKNYKQILANQKKKADNDHVTEDTKKVMAEPKFKLKPMPEIFLIDPITGLLPKNYKEILAERKAAGLSIHTYRQGPKTDIAGMASQGSKRKSDHSEFKVSNVVAKQNVPRMIIPDSTGQTNVKTKCVRKALFGGPRRTSGFVKARPSQMLKKTSSADSNDTLPLLNFEDSVEELHIFRKIPKRVIKKLPASNLTPAKKTGQERSSKSSNSSMEEFLKQEQLCKTPKSIMKAKQQQNFNNCRNADDDIDKMNTMYREIEENNKIIINENRQIEDSYRKIKEEHEKIKESSRIIKERSLKIEGLLNKRTGINLNSTDSKENSQLSAIDQSSHNPIRNETTLRISTLRKNVERKVLFNLHDNNITGSPIVMKKSKVVLKTCDTPNTMVRTMTSIAEKQYSLLQGTPKVSP